MDDGTLGGSLDDVLDDLHTVRNAAEDLGLHLNLTKSEVICVDPRTKDTMLNAAHDLCIVSPEQATLLGSPTGSIESINSAIRTKVNALKITGSRLHHLHAHDAFCLLHHAYSIPKMLYILRSSPCFLSPQLEEFDHLQRLILSDICNINLVDNNSVWTQASLPVRSGGLGIRSAVQLAPSAFLASAAGSSDLIHQILPPRLLDTPYSASIDALTVWSQEHPEPPSPAPACCRQKAWDNPQVCATYENLLDTAPDTYSRSRLLAAAKKESGAWLHAFPMSALGLRMDDEVIQVAIGLRLGATLC